MSDHFIENSKLKKTVNVGIIYASEITKNIFWDLANTINYTLQELGFNASINFNTIYTEENITNIILGAHLIYEPDIPILNENSIIVNTEQLASLQFRPEPHYKMWFHKTLYLASKCQVWDYSKKNIELFNQFGLTHPQYLKLGYSPILNRIPSDHVRDIDVLFYGSMTERREHIIHQLSNRGVNVVALKDVFGEELDRYISRSKIVLNVHFFDSQIFEIVRCFYLMNNGVAIVSEVNKTTEIESDYLDGIAGVPYEQLVDKCCELLSYPDELEKLRQKALATIQQFPQTEIIKKLIVN